MGPAFFDGQGLSCRFQNVNVNALTMPVSGNSAGTSLSGRGSSGAISGKSSPPATRGSFHPDSLRFGAIQATSVNLQIKVFPGQAYLDNLKLQFAGGAVNGKAAVDFSQQNLLYSVKSAFQKIDVAQLLIAFPSARRRMTGIMQGHIDLDGRAAHSSDPQSGLRGSGYVVIRNGRLSFPFAVGGTLDNPRFVLKTTKGVLSGISTGSACGGKQGAQPGNAIQSLINLFSKKKTPPR